MSTRFGVLIEHQGTPDSSEGLWQKPAMLQKAAGGSGVSSLASNKWDFPSQEHTRLHLFGRMSKIGRNEPVEETWGLIEPLPAATASVERWVLGWPPHF